MPENDLQLLTSAARKAGHIAKSYFDKGAKKWDKPGDAGPVTEADLAVNDMLEDVLRSARPDFGWLSEETTDTQDRQNVERVFIVDPIDGTRNFIEGGKTWSHSLAIAENGQVTAAAVFLPMRDMMFFASAKGGAFLNETPLHLAGSQSLADANVLATKPNMQPHHWKDGAVPTFKRHHRPSLAYRLALVAQGSFDAMLTLRPSWEWDIAAGALIAHEAGATVTNQHGDNLIFNNPVPQVDGVVAAPTDLHDALINQLAPA